MDEARYWCHMCSQSVDPIMEVDSIKCPFCESGFVEEIESSSAEQQQQPQQQHQPHDFDGGSDSDRALSLWAPILLGMLSSPRRRRRQHRLELENDDENEDENNNSNNSNSDRQRDTELDRELEAIIRRRRRSSATILQLLQGIRAGMLSAESENHENENRDRDRDRDQQDNSGSNNSTTNNRDRERERVILINPFNQTIIVQGSYDMNNNNNTNSNNINAQNTIGSLGDYFIGPGLDLLLQHLAENDQNRYGTPPAQKEAVEAMPTVKIEQESFQCAVCLDDFEVGAEAKEMPCKHRFHDGCILPWLELHSSCPVCRYQLPADESKIGSEMSRNGSSNNGSNGEEGDDDERNGNGRRLAVPLPWPFSTLFSPPGSQITNGNSSSNSPSSSSNAAESASHRADEN